MASCFPTWKVNSPWVWAAKTVWHSEGVAKKTQILKNDTSILKRVKLAMMPCTTHNFMVDLFVWILHRQKSNWLCFSSCFSQIWHYFCLHGNFMVTFLCRPPSGNKALMKIKFNNNWRNIEKSWCFVFPIFEINKAAVLKASTILGVVYGGSPHSWKVPEPSTFVTHLVRLPRHFPPLWPAAT